MFLSCSHLLRMSKIMWNSPDKPIPQANYIREHLRVLSEAVADSDMYDMRSNAVYEALEYIEKECSHLAWPCTQFREALENWCPANLDRAWQRIKNGTYV